MSSRQLTAATVPTAASPAHLAHETSVPTTTILLPTNTATDNVYSGYKGYKLSGSQGYTDMWHLNLGVILLTTACIFLAMSDTSLAQTKCADPAVTYKKIQLFGPHDKTGTWKTTLGNIKVVIEHIGEPMMSSMGTGNWEVSVRVNSSLCGNIQPEDIQDSFEGAEERSQSVSEEFTSVDGTVDDEVERIIVEESREEMNSAGQNELPDASDAREREDAAARSPFSGRESLVSWLDRWRTQYQDYGQAGLLKLFADSLPWKQAKERCEVDGAQLTTVDTPQKVQALLDMFSRNPRVPKRSVLKNQVYVGINDREEEGVYKTASGQLFMPWNSSVWMPNEPDDRGGDEDCVTFHTRGRIRDVPCHFSLPFFCEMRQHARTSFP